MRIVLFIIFNLIFVGIKGQITFVIESLPNTTPEEDTIFITGTFNNWNVNDENFMLHPQLDGKYSITLPVDTGIIEFKFTRGSWLKVETNETNGYIPNRVFTYGKGHYYFAKIQNWQDLGGVRGYNYIVLFLFAIAFYGISLLFFAFRIHIRSKSFIRSFFLLNACLIISLIGGVFYNQANLIWQSHIGMLGIVVLFVWGPLFYIFLCSLSGKTVFKNIGLHFFPAFIVILIAFLRFLNFGPLSFYAKEFNPNLSWGNSVLITFGIFANVVYHAVVYKQVLLRMKSNNKLPKRISLINMLFFISAGALLFLSLNFIFLVAGTGIGTINNFEVILILLSIIIFVEFYYYWKYPELFQKVQDISNFSRELKNQSIKKADYFFSTKQVIQKVPQPSLPDEMAKLLKNRIIEQMIEKKAYKNPQLNIARLSEIIETKPHILSKVLNEQFNKSFRDFINEYRIKEFIKLAASEKYKNYTLLALSYEVGFNSKSTFNLAFKKVTGVPPRNFLKNKRINLN